MFRISDKLQLLGSHYVSQAVRIMATLAMARLLTPEDYGFVALVLTLPGFFGSLGDFGVGRCIVQFRDADERQLLDTGFVLSLILRGGTALLTLASGAWLANHYNQPALLWVGVIYAANTMLVAVYQFQLACLSRRMAFALEARQMLIMAGAQAATGLVLAFSGFGVFALAFQALAAQLAANAFLWRAQPLRAPTRVRGAMVRRYLVMGWKITAASYTDKVKANILNAVVAFFGGATALGLIGRGTQVRDLFLHNTLTSFDRLLYPIFSNNQKDPARLREVFLRGERAVCLLAFLGTAGLMATAPDLIRVMLGPQWAEVPPLLVALAPSVAFTGVMLPAITLMLATGQPTVWLRYNLLYLLLFTPAIVLAGAYGLEPLCWATTGAYAVIALMEWRWVLRHLGTGVGEACRDIAVLFLSAAASYLAMIGVNAAAERWLVLPRFLVSGAAGVAVFAGLVWLFDKETVRELQALIQRKPKPAPADHPEPTEPGPADSDSQSA
ncbi:MAG: oligosaccharide flippase family protein [Sumerlaeia bacterium]